MNATASQSPMNNTAQAARARMARAPNQLTSFLNMGADLRPRLWHLRHNTGNFTKIWPFGENLPGQNAAKSAC